MGEVDMSRGRRPTGHTALVDAVWSGETRALRYRRPATKSLESSSYKQLTTPLKPKGRELLPIELWQLPASKYPITSALSNVYALIVICDSMVRKATNRRSLLMGTGAAAAATLAGCMGNGDGNGDDGDDFFPYDRPDDWPDRESFTPNPNVEGPGGEAMVTTEVSLREDYRAVDEFEKMEVNFKQLDMYHSDKGWVEIPVERTFDFYHFDVGETIIPQWAAEIPAGRYTHVNFHMFGSEIIHEEEGDVTDNWEEPEQAGITTDEEVILEDGDQLTLYAHRLWVRDTPTLEFGRGGVGIGVSGGGFYDMTDPSIYAEEE